MPKHDLVKRIDQRLSSSGSTVIYTSSGGSGTTGTTPEEVEDILQESFIAGNSDRVYFGASTWLTAGLATNDSLMNVDAFLFAIGDYVVLQHQTATAEVVLITDLGGAQYTIERGQFGTAPNSFDKYKTKVTRIFSAIDSGNVVAQSAGVEPSPYTSTWVLDAGDTPLWKTSVGRLVEATQEFRDSFPFWVTWDNVLGYAGDTMRALEANIVYGRVEHDFTTHRWLKGTGWDADDAPSNAGGELGSTAAGLGVSMLNKAGYPWAAFTSPYTSDIKNLLFYVDTNKAERILQYEYLDNTDEWFFRVGGIRQKADHLAFFSETPIEKPVLTGTTAGITKDLFTALHNYGLIQDDTVIGGPDGLNFIGPKTADYQIEQAEIVRIGDHSSELTLLTPRSPKKNDTFGVKIDTDSQHLVNVDADTRTIESPYKGVAAGSSVGMLGNGALVMWSYDGSKWCVIGDAKLIPYVEFWQVVPITDVSGAGEVIQWTFNTDLSTLLSPIIGSYSNGIWTMDTQDLITASIRSYAEFVLGGNNQDASLVVTSFFSGTGANIILPGADAIAHSRSGTFYSSIETVCKYVVGPGNTVEFTAQSDAVQSGQTNLPNALLEFRIG